MVFGFVFKNGNSLSHDSLANNGSRLSLNQSSFIKGGYNCTHVMAINNKSMPIKSLKFFIERSNIFNVFNKAINLNAIVVEKRHPIIQVTIPCTHRSFPHHSLLS